MAPIDPNPIAVIDSAAHARGPTPQTTTDSLEVAQQPGQSGAVAGSALAATASTTTDKTAAIAGATTGASVQLPRITIRFCTQCRWMLRAAYFAQELLSTFSTTLGEVALIPATGGVFTVTILAPRTRVGAEGEGQGGEGERTADGAVVNEETVLWDRKTQGGFPETKQLKALVRNIVEPSRDLGHVDRALKKGHRQEHQERGQKEQAPTQKESTTTETAGTGSGTSGDKGEKGKAKEEGCEDCQ